MKCIAPVVLSAAIAAGQSAPGRTSNTARRPVKQYTMEQFLDTTSIQGGCFSADDWRLFSSNKTATTVDCRVAVAAHAGLAPR